MTTLDGIRHLRTAGDRGSLDHYLEGLKGLDVHWPEPPAEELLFKLGPSREHLARLYGHLDLRFVNWSIEEASAAELAAATVPWDEGLERVDQVARDLDYTIDLYREIFGHEVWSGTWSEPPFLARGHLMSPPVEGLHLMEGHTRMGILRGSLLRGDIEPSSLHRVWVASYAAR